MPFWTRQQNKVICGLKNRLRYLVSLPQISPFSPSKETEHMYASLNYYNRTWLWGLNEENVLLYLVSLTKIAPFFPIKRDKAKLPFWTIATKWVWGLNKENGSQYLVSLTLQVSSINPLNPTGRYTGSRMGV